MSEETLKYQNTRIAQLEKEKADLQVALKQARNERREAVAARDEVQARHDELLAQADEQFTALDAEVEEWKGKATAAPSELAAEVETLKGAIRTRDHRDEWAKAVGAELHEKASIEKLWGEVGYTPEGDKPTPEQISEWVGKARDAAPYLFVKTEAAGSAATPQGGPKPPLKVAEPPGRGARDTASGPVRISRSEMATPGWMTKDKAKAEAFRSGDYTPTDD